LIAGKKEAAQASDRNDKAAASTTLPPFLTLSSPLAQLAARRVIHAQQQKGKPVMSITLKSGLNTLSVDVPEGTSVGQILSNSNYAAVLNFDTSNVEGLIGGAKANLETTLFAGDTLLIQKLAHSKAA
jgi:hypothetical protein